MKTTKAIIIFILMFSQSIYSQTEQNLEKLVNTEKAFAKTALEKSVKQAFLEFLSDDGLIFQPNATNAQKFWQARPESKALLAWNPVWADISMNGQIGYTTGDWDFRPKGKDDTPVAFGQYITIWKLQADGEFKAILDIGVSHDKPEKVETAWKSPKEKTQKKNPKQKELKNPPSLKTNELNKFFAADIRMYRDGKFPFIGTKYAKTEIQKENKLLKQSNILKEKCESSDGFRYCYGEIERIKKDNSTEKGNSVQIWKFRNGYWRLVLDIYTAIPAK